MTSRKSGGSGYVVLKTDSMLRMWIRIANLEPGMYFVSLGGQSIPELRERHHRLLNENHAERENWTPILSLYDEGEVENSEGIRCTIFLAHYEKQPYKSHVFRSATDRGCNSYYNDRFCKSRCHCKNDN